MELPESKLGRLHTVYQQCFCWPPTSTLHQPGQCLRLVLQDAASCRQEKHLSKCMQKAILCWAGQCEHLLCIHKDADTNKVRDDAANNLFSRLNDKRSERWTDTVESIDFTHSSRRAWQTINKLTGRSTTSTHTMPNTTPNHHKLHRLTAAEQRTVSQQGQATCQSYFRKSP